MIEIPIQPITDSTQEVDLSTTLDNGRYSMRLSWSERVGRWYLDCSSVGPDQVVGIIKGAPLMIGYPILAGNPNPNRPPGELFLMTRVDSLEDYRKEHLGQQVYLAYLSAAELGR